MSKNFINNEILLEAAKKFGTPLYIYDGNYIENQYSRLAKAFNKIPFRINYACKANTNLALLKIVNKLGSGLDTASIGEVYLGLKAGFKPEMILYTPNCVSFEEIKEAIALGVHINIDNITMLELLGSEFLDTVPVCIRINPHLVAGGNAHIQTGHIDSKFGISIHQLRHVHRIVEAHNIKVHGVHMHTGSDILDTDAFIRGLEVLLEVAEGFKDLEYIDFGSGFKVPYKEGDVETDIDALGDAVAELFNNFCDRYGKKLELWCEPGKFLVSEAGSFLVKVNVVKQTVASVFAGVNSGLNHLIRPMMYDAYHKISNISNTNGFQRIYNVVGNICETDTFGWDRKLNEVREGDILRIHNAGAYGFSMSSQYNSRFRPAEALYFNNDLILIRNRETLEDLVKNQIDLEI